MAAPRTSVATSRTCCQLLLCIKAPDSRDTSFCSCTGRVQRRCCRCRATSARDAHRGRRLVKCGGAWKAEGGGVEGRRRRWRHREQSIGQRGREKERRREEEDE
ncbi:hypothetical protein GUJ93_ZPchr0002g25582 [Zizania palustris]|uniref:Uncharacterized protein n=1 Tax=Zizania palustris TaxID=103762 RepID=A0A8J5SIP1_ZIZPA|nr:hypothetical protein GUJ93_ZPchr0002g25582 [Zizania palustris]